MNKLINDRGEEVIAIGTEGSIARARQQYPEAIKKIIAHIEVSPGGEIKVDEEAVIALLKKLKIKEDDQKMIVEAATMHQRAIRNQEWSVLSLPKQDALKLMNSIMKKHGVVSATRSSGQEYATFVMEE